MALCKRAASTVAQPSRFREAWPTLGLSAGERSRGINPPFTGAAPSIDSGRPAATHRRRWCRGGSLDQGEPMGGGRVEEGSPQRHLHGSGARSAGKQRRWTAGGVEVLGELVDE
jgi:hypothetical protein